MKAKEARTAADYARMKDHLDEKMSLAIKNGDQRTVYDLAQLKHQLIAAIENHTDPEIAAIWKDGPETFAAPERVKEAYELGKLLLDPRTRLDLIQQRFRDATVHEFDGLRGGVREDVARRLKGAVADLRAAMHSTEARPKLDWLVGPERAQRFLLSIEGETPPDGL